MNVRVAGWAAVVGGAAWAVTPLRDVFYGAAVGPGAYAVYEGIVALIVVLLALGLRTVLGVSRAGVAVVLAGYLMIVVSAVPVGPAAVDQTLADIGFFGSMVAAIGAIPLGIALWRRGARTAGALLVLALPAGLPLLLAISAAGQPGVAGLAVTLPYGAAWCLLGLQEQDLSGTGPAVGGLPRAREAGTAR